MMMMQQAWSEPECLPDFPITTLLRSESFGSRVRISLNTSNTQPVQANDGLETRANLLEDIRNSRDVPATADDRVAPDHMLSIITRLNQYSTSPRRSGQGLPAVSRRQRARSVQFIQDLSQQEHNRRDPAHSGPRRIRDNPRANLLEDIRNGGGRSENDVAAQRIGNDPRGNLLEAIRNRGGRSDNIYVVSPPQPPPRHPTAPAPRRIGNNPRGNLMEAIRNRGGRSDNNVARSNNRRQNLMNSIRSRPRLQSVNPAQPPNPAPRRLSLQEQLQQRLARRRSRIAPSPPRRSNPPSLSGFRPPEPPRRVRERSSGPPELSFRRESSRFPLSFRRESARRNPPQRRNQPPAQVAPMKFMGVDDILPHIHEIEELSDLQKILEVTHAVMKKRLAAIEESRPDLCMMCISAKKDVAFPCGHVCSCRKCAKKLRKRQCPICRHAFRHDQLITIYL